jgi:RNA polymerase sigma-70 factor (ECF subfamily)
VTDERRGAAEFERHRPRLRALAYRMLGTLSDTDDVLQDAFLRWHGADGDAVRSPEAWLVTVVTRLCIDRLRVAAAERSAYAGPWLPEPWIGDAEGPLVAADGDASPDGRLDRAADLSMAFMLLLERLAPEERAAFLLHDVFEIGYPDIARTLDRTEASCRQIVHRARERVRREDGRPRFAVTAASHRRLLEQYIEASRAGDTESLLALFAPDATFTSDGGGKTWAARNVIRGAGNIARLVAGLTRKITAAVAHEVVTVNGGAGFLTYHDGKLISATAIETDGARILAVYRVLNPDKLDGIGAGRDPAS